MAAARFPKNVSLQWKSQSDQFYLFEIMQYFCMASYLLIRRQKQGYRSFLKTENASRFVSKKANHPKGWDAKPLA
jgi:hypothetical protein